MKTISTLLMTIVTIAIPLTMQGAPATVESDVESQIPNMIEDLNPFAPDIEEILEQYDRIYEEETGLPSHLVEDITDDILGLARCQRAECPVWAQIVKSTQRMYLHINGVLNATWKVSTGKAGFGTPNFDRNPDGRIYDKYTSRKYPGGDWKGLGNMPYAVFISGGFAIHGTPQGNWSRLGTRASHGCIRLHPDNGFYFNRLVRSQGIRNVWITVQ